MKIDKINLDTEKCKNLQSIIEEFIRTGHSYGLSTRELFDLYEESVAKYLKLEGPKRRVLKKYGAQIDGFDKKLNIVYMGAIDDEGQCIRFQTPLNLARWYGLTKIEIDQAFNYTIKSSNIIPGIAVYTFELVEGNPMTEEEVEKMVRENREKFKRLR